MRLKFTVSAVLKSSKLCTTNSKLLEEIYCQIHVRLNSITFIIRKRFLLTVPCIESRTISADTSSTNEYQTGLFRLSYSISYLTEHQLRFLFNIISVRQVSSSSMSRNDQSKYGPFTENNCEVKLGQYHNTRFDVFQTPFFAATRCEKDFIAVFSRPSMIFEDACNNESIHPVNLVMSLSMSPGLVPIRFLYSMLYRNSAPEPHQCSSQDKPQIPTCQFWFSSLFSEHWRFQILMWGHTFLSYI